MNGIGDQLLAGSALSQNQNRRISPCHQLDLLEYGSHLAVRSENASETELIFQHRFEILVFAPQGHDAAHPFDEQQQFVHLERLRDVIEGTELHRANRRFYRSVGGNHHDLRVRRLLFGGCEHRKPVRARQSQIGDH